MFSTILQYTADHRYLVQAAAQAGGIEDPIAFEAGAYLYPLLQCSQRGAVVPVDGALVRSWPSSHRYFFPGMSFGIRLYQLKGISFARCVAQVDKNANDDTYGFLVTSRRHYLQLFRHVLQFQRKKEKPELPPVLPEAQLSLLRQNTLGYLNRKNLARIRELGGRPKRGLLLTGPPGNGKTSACRWLWKECSRLGYEYRMVSPDAYRAARQSCNPVQAVKDLFSVERHGVVFFDDMDIALRDRNTVQETDDQAVFLSALDGIEVNEGVVYVFTTNCSVSLIDPAFKRPGRIDLIMPFEKPDDTLRRRLMERWHPDIRSGIDADLAVKQTNGLSFAEVEEMKNLLILRHLEAGNWDWAWAVNQFRVNRSDLSSTNARPIGFVPADSPAKEHTNGVSSN